MPKLKSHKGASKRFKLTGTGKVKRGHSGLRHMLTSKAHKRKRKLGTATLVSDGDLRKVKRMIPYQEVSGRWSVISGQKVEGFSDH